jgi:UDP-N-acetylmuramoyl-L-alanyl-D-glutamate--2,6-diaminopimelate ligase
MREQGVEAAALEVSSHALVMGRVNGLVVDVAVFTNLSQDHLDFHGTMEHYFAAKAMLFTPERAHCAVICIDDPYGHRLAQQARTLGLPVTTVGRRLVDPDVVVDPVGPRPDGGQRVRLTGAVAAEVDLALPGRFNATNAALALVAATRLLDIRGSRSRQADEELARLTAGLARVRVPGRMEVVPGGPPLGVVDFAHTPKAIETVLTELRASSRGRLIVVLGAGGDRDRTKRPAMGEAAGRLADVVIVTDDNPRSEEPRSIRRAVLAGLEPVASARHVPVFEVADRAEAVRQAVALAGPDDTVAVLGKGHEQGQEVAGVVRPFDARQVLAQALRARHTAGAAERRT